jgi:hypothetical protein
MVALARLQGMDADRAELTACAEIVANAYTRLMQCIGMAAVPEPETLALLLAGMVGGVVTTRQRRRSFSAPNT